MHTILAEALATARSEVTHWTERAAWWRDRMKSPADVRRCRGNVRRARQNVREIEAMLATRVSA